jgi:hypothetical protein
MLETSNSASRRVQPCKPVVRSAAAPVFTCVSRCLKTRGIQAAASTCCLTLLRNRRAWSWLHGGDSCGAKRLESPLQVAAEHPAAVGALACSPRQPHASAAAGGDCGRQTAAAAAAVVIRALRHS